MLAQTARIYEYIMHTHKYLYLYMCVHMCVSAYLQYGYFQHLDPDTHSQ